MPNPSGPDRDHTSNAPGFDPDDVDRGAATDPAESDAETTEHVAAPDDNPTESYRSEPATEVMATSEHDQQAAKPRTPRGERRFTAPGFDAKETAVINAAIEPATEVFDTAHPSGPTGAPPRTATPQLIPPRLGAKLRP